MNINIKQLILPLVCGADGIEDKDWQIAISKSSDNGYVTRVKMSNFFDRIVSGKARQTEFYITFFIDKTGKLEFGRICIKNQECSSYDQRLELYEGLYGLFGRISAINGK